MNAGVRQPPPLLLSGLKAVAGRADCRVLRGPFYSDLAFAWVLEVELTIDETSAHVPLKPRWFVHIPEVYPHGSISFYPAKDGGLEGTFPHQDHNTRGPDERPWRDGRICPNSPFGKSWFPVADRDPVDDPEARLAWHIDRTLRWLRAAATNALLAPGDPFELPQYDVPVGPGLRIIHDETPESFAAWSKTSDGGQFGPVELRRLPVVPDKLVAEVFRDRDGIELRRWRDGNGPPSKDVGEDVRGFWWLWPSTIHLPPWAPPRSWADLRAAAKAVNVNFDQALRWMADRTRRSKKAICLLGFPMPRTMGTEPVEIHWQAIDLPPPTPLKKKGHAGFRSRTKALRAHDKMTRFRNDRSLKFLATENWSDARLLARGRLNKAITEQRVALLGVGALGSAIARMLVQAGVRDLLLVDGDALMAGNVCRHALSLFMVGIGKAHALKVHLATVSPHVRVEAFDTPLPPEGPAVAELLDSCDVVIDCTANDEVLSILEGVRWPIPKKFASFSLGRQGRRLLAFVSHGPTFDGQAFRDGVAPWLEDEAQEWKGDDEVFEGAGCWSPLYPARTDDVMMAAATAVKLIEGQAVTMAGKNSKLIVFEQATDPDGLCGGYHRVTTPADSNL